MKAVSISCGNNHSLVLFETDKQQQVLYSVGNKIGSEFAHLGPSEELCENEDLPFREISVFNDRKLDDFLAHWNASITIMNGSKQATENLYVHKLPENKVSKGLLHFFKKGDKWTFIPQEEYEARKSELPALSFAIKCPIEDIA